MSEPEPHEEVGAAIRAGAVAVRAPDRLHARIANRRAAATARARPRARPMRVAATAALAAALAVAFVVMGGGGPSVQAVAAAGLKAPTRPAPAPDSRDTASIRARVDGLPFPNLERPWGWEAAGARTDRVAGRRAVTIVYRSGALGVHYTIVAGDPLAVPDGAGRRPRVNGRSFTVLRDRGAQVVAWERGGHTCVLASRTVDAAGLLRFANW